MTQFLSKSQPWIRFIFLMYFCDGYIKLVLIRQENDCVPGLFAKAHVPVLCLTRVPASATLLSLSLLFGHSSLMPSSCLSRDGVAGPGCLVQ